MAKSPRPGQDTDESMHAQSDMLG